MSREKVYALLREHPGEFFSGEEISRRLGVSRAALFRELSALQSMGAIEVEGHAITMTDRPLLQELLHRSSPAK